MAFAKNIYWFRPGRLINSERKNPGILAVDEKYELTAHVFSSDKKCWTYSCKYMPRRRQAENKKIYVIINWCYIPHSLVKVLSFEVVCGSCERKGAIG